MNATLFCLGVGATIGATLLIWSLCRVARDTRDVRVDEDAL